MNALALVTALAAQATAPSGSTVPSVDTSTSANASHLGSITFVDLEAAAGYSTNSVQNFGGSTGSAFGRFSIDGVHTRVSDRTSTSISALAQDAIYARGGRSRVSANLRANHFARVSETLSLYGSAEASVDKGGQLDNRIIGNQVIPIVPGQVQPPVVLLPGTDTLFVTGRTYRIFVNAGAQLALSTRDSMHFSAGLQHVTSKSGVLDTRYTGIPLTIGYNRDLNTRTSIGADVHYQRTDYNGPASFWSVSPRLTIRQALSERLSLSASIGPSFGTSDDGVTKRHSTGVAADASLCSVLGQRTNFCGTFSLTQQAATAVGASRSVSAGFSYSRRLDADSVLRFSLNGSRYSRPAVLVTGTSFSHATYTRAAADYSRRISGRWFGGMNVAARKLTQPGPDPKMDFSGSAFIRFRLGDLG